MEFQLLYTSTYARFLEVTVLPINRYASHLKFFFFFFVMKCSHPLGS